MALTDDELDDTPVDEFNDESPEHEAPEEYGLLEPDEPPAAPAPPDLEDQNPIGQVD